jgi:hypothetical protein
VFNKGRRRKKKEGRKEKGREEGRRKGGEEGRKKRTKRTKRKKGRLTWIVTIVPIVPTSGSCAPWDGLPMASLVTFQPRCTIDVAITFTNASFQSFGRCTVSTRKSY